MAAATPGHPRQHQLETASSHSILPLSPSLSRPNQVQGYVPRLEPQPGHHHQARLLQPRHHGQTILELPRPNVISPPSLLYKTQANHQYPGGSLKQKKNGHNFSPPLIPGEFRRLPESIRRRPSFPCLRRSLFYDPDRPSPNLHQQIQPTIVRLLQSPNSRTPSIPNPSSSFSFSFNHSRRAKNLLDLT